MKFTKIDPKKTNSCNKLRPGYPQKCTREKPLRYLWSSGPSAEHFVDNPRISIKVP